VLQKSKPSLFFPKLFEPGYIEEMQIKNRIVRAPTTTSSSTNEGWPTERMIHHYRAVARGGSGLIIVENSYIDDIAAKQSPTQLSMSNTFGKGGLAILVSLIRACGAKVAIQLGHAGAQKSFGSLKSPSGVPITVPWDENPPPSPVPEELKLEEIKEIIEAFGNATLRAKQIGFDMVEILGCHGYLVSQFLSSLTNKRNDKYGGDLTGRLRFLLEIIENQRQKVGPGFPLSVRLSCTDYLEGGVTVEDTTKVAKALEEAGVSVLHISGGVHVTMQQEVAPMYMAPGNHIWAIGQIKNAVHIPIIASGAITTPELAEKILEEGKADFISLCRPLLADPYFALKAKEGRPEDIAPCIRCGDGCIARGFRSGTTCCSVNATVCKEEELRITPVAKVKKVGVVGAGPAGMEAARVAALRGHEVTIFEKRKLGGALIEASVPDFKADIRRLIAYLSTQIKKLGVKIIDAEATSQTIKESKFDAVIVATGAIPRIPEVPGVTKSSVLQALDVLRGTKTENNVVVVGGGMIGRDVGLFLAEQGKKVTVTTRGDSLTRGMNISERFGYLERFSKQHIEVQTGLYLGEVTDRGVVMFDRNGANVEIQGETVVLASGLKPNKKLFDELTQTTILEVYAIGDCAEPRMIYDAIHEGFEVAFELL
jgi:2,4-dienoyl-CoA reductase-like NADH-dependent reductase (Old Yellow Enzyme family)/thioredoxin reductase